MAMPNQLGFFGDEHSRDAGGDSGPTCTPGWGDRCASSTRARCTCACGGHNHGGRRGDHCGDSLERTPDEHLHYAWDEPRPPRPQLLVPDDRVIDCVRITRPGPWGDVTEARVYLDGQPLPRRLVRHSPTGFEWGYGGSGPADLALNILALLVSPKEASRFYQDFKFAVIATLPSDEGRIALSHVRQWLDAQYDREASEAQAG